MTQSNEEKLLDLEYQLMETLLRKEALIKQCVQLEKCLDIERKKISEESARLWDLMVEIFDVKTKQWATIEVEYNEKL